MTVTVKENIDLCRDKGDKWAKNGCQGNEIMLSFPTFKFVLNMAFIFFQKKKILKIPTMPLLMFDIST